MNAWAAVPSRAAAKDRRRVVCGLAACGAAGASLIGLHDPLASMTNYTAALMTLNQLAPPLLLLAVSHSRQNPPLRLRVLRPVTDWLLDPWVAGVVFTMVSIGISLPQIFEPALANALFAAPLGLLEFAAGLLLWAQILPSTSRFEDDRSAGLFAIAMGVPMTVVAVVWMTSPHVLYSPYLNVLCLWNLTPLEDQRWSGFVMLILGVPMQLRGVWLLALPDRRGGAQPDPVGGQ
jgi:putative membrane protein